VNEAAGRRNDREVYNRNPRGPQGRPGTPARSGTPCHLGYTFAPLNGAHDQLVCHEPSRHATVSRRSRRTRAPWVHFLAVWGSPRRVESVFAGGECSSWARYPVRGPRRPRGLRNALVGRRSNIRRLSTDAGVWRSAARRWSWCHQGHGPKRGGMSGLSGTSVVLRPGSGWQSLAISSP
jgi:hypothetical protein